MRSTLIPCFFKITCFLAEIRSNLWSILIHIFKDSLWSLAMGTAHLPNLLLSLLSCKLLFTLASFKCLFSSCVAFSLNSPFGYIALAHCCCVFVNIIYLISFSISNYHSWPLNKTHSSDCLSITITLI